MQMAAVAPGVRGNPICLDDDPEPVYSGLRETHKRKRGFDYFDHSPGSRTRYPEVITIDDDEPPPVHHSMFVNRGRAMPSNTRPLAKRRVVSPTLKVELGVLALPCPDPGPSAESLLIWNPVQGCPSRPPEWDRMARKPDKPVAASLPCESGISYQEPLQRDAATLSVESLECMQAMGDYDDFVDYKIRPEDAAQFGINCRDPLRLRDDVEGNVTAFQEVKSGPVADASPPLPEGGCLAVMNVAETLAGRITMARVNSSKKIKVVARGKMRELKGQPDRVNTVEVMPGMPDDSEVPEVKDEQTEEEERLLAEKRKKEEWEAELWRSAAVAFELAKPLATEKEEKPEGCNHTFVRNPENGQSCEDCGIVKPAMSVEYAAPMRAAYRKARKKDDEMEGIDEEVALTNPDDIPEAAETPAETLKIKVPPHFLPKMKEHQIQAFKFAVKCLDGRGGCIFAHAPGTGKTFSIISFVKALLTHYPEKKVLIVAPKGMLVPWREEFNRWKVKDITIYDVFEKAEEKDASEKRRGILQRWKDNKSVLLATYGIVTSLISKGNDEYGLRKELVETPDVVILDEGHCLHTEKSQVLTALQQVRTKSRVLLSGTLFQNNFRELYNLLKFVKEDFLKSDPDFMKTMKAQQECAGMSKKTWQKKQKTIERKLFMEKFDSIRCEQNDAKARYGALQAISKLRSLLPFVDCVEGTVLKLLPGLHEYVIKLRLLPAQADLVRGLKALDLDHMSFHTCASQVSIHPAALSTDKCKARIEVPTGEDTRLDPGSGVKTNFVFQILNLCHKAGEKLVIFSNKTTALDLIQKMLIRCLNWNLGDEILRIDGKGQGKDRSATTRKFNDQAHQSQVFLGSIKACGEGISLVGASRMILLDPSWNPSVTCQAVSRSFRLGQTRKVFVYHLVADDAGEGTIRETAVGKEWVSKNLFGSKEVMDQEVEVDPRKSVDLFFQSNAVMRDVQAVFEVVRQ